MSKSRLERNPDLKCGFSWPSDPRQECPHICQRTVLNHGDTHLCCRSDGGMLPVIEGDHQ